MKTIKGDTTKRFLARYGLTVRKKLLKIESLSRARYDCPYCNGESTVRKLSVGIWYCNKCNKKFTGKAYTLSKK